MGLFKKALKVAMPINYLAAKAGLKGAKAGGLIAKNAAGLDKTSTAHDAAAGRLISGLESQAAGKGPSLVGEQSKQAQDANLANTVSALKGSGGMSQALKNRAALRAGERAGTQTARDTSLGKLKERSDAQKQLTSAITGIRGQDVDAEMARKKQKGDMFGKAIGGISSMLGLGG